MVTSLVSSLGAADAGSDPVALLMLRKTLDLQAQSMTQLLQSAPAVSGGSNPPHLGNNIDIKV
ncbi:MULTISPECIES: YjfB family protein [Burkholderiaceae]|uniref:Putative motility protein n=1 Tax=Cupriavidus pauculus TaxID=82633 RepID=A0A2N5CHA4_9BURK|nr:MULTISPECIES: YjfB family protein [Burkholderiaceae]PLQ01584.1 putative motility protein [Cupriavidus pauculus]SDO70182.1 Putative motility protein [Ralstonia sp. 25mfcol4.1]